MDPTQNPSIDGQRSLYALQVHKGRRSRVVTAMLVTSGVVMRRVVAGKVVTAGVIIDQGRHSQGLITMQSCEDGIAM